MLMTMSLALAGAGASAPDNDAPATATAAIDVLTSLITIPPHVYLVFLPRLTLFSALTDAIFVASVRRTRPIATNGRTGFLGE